MPRDYQMPYRGGDFPPMAAQRDPQPEPTPDPEELARLRIGCALEDLWEAFRGTRNPSLAEHLLVAMGSVKDAQFQAQRLCESRNKDTEGV